MIRGAGVTEEMIELVNSRTGLEVARMIVDTEYSRCCFYVLYIDGTVAKGCTDGNNYRTLWDDEAIQIRNNLMTLQVSGPGVYKIKLNKKLPLNYSEDV